MKKRGLSTIIVTLIIILLSLVAVAVVWFAVKNLLVGGSKEIGFGKFTINLDIVNAYEQAGNISVDVKRGTGSGELSKLKFILSDGKKSETITVDSNMGELDDKIFSVHPIQIAPPNVAKVSIAPVVKSSDGSDIVGEIADTYNLISGGIAPGVNETGGEECIQNCGNFQCGPDLVCEQSCGSCGADTCINHVCVPQNCVDDSKEATCGIRVCGTKINNCGKEVDCGNCAAGQMCNSDLGSCVTILPVNSGKVEDTWPGTSGMYFGSSTLPIDISYQGYYIKFPGSAETDCLLIVGYIFPVVGYSKSHIAFNFETSIKANDDYQIWETIEECQTAI